MALATPSEDKIYTSVYSDFRGVDFTSDPTQVFKRRSPDALNMMPDEGGVPYKRQGWVTEYTSPVAGRIRDMWSFDYGDASHILYTKGNGLYRFGDSNPLITFESEQTQATGIYFNAITGGVFYILADSVLRQYTKKDDVFAFEEVEAYVPTTLISRSPSGGGTSYEDVNLLTRRRKESFLGNSTSTDYYTALPIKENTEVIKVKNSSATYDTLVKGTHYTVDYATGRVTFVLTHAPVVTGEDNVIIEYTATGTNAASEQLKRCTVASVYNNKVFLSGASGAYKSYVWHSAYNDATYFPDLSYFVVGDDFTSVMGLVDLGEYLGIIKESSAESSTVFLAYSLTFDETSSYAVKQSITGVGALSRKSFGSLNGEQIFLSEDGLYGVSAVMSSESNNYTATTSVMNRSYYINKRLLKEPNLENAVCTVWNRFYLLCINNHCYVMDGTQKNSWATERSNLQYECYYWDNIPATAFCTHDGDLWFGTEDGRICRFKNAGEFGNETYNDDGMPINAYWSTILDNDGATHYFKNLQKKGCLVTVQSLDTSIANTSAEVYIRSDDNKPVYIGAIAAEGTDIPQDFYIKKKIKKYKRMQIVVKNDILNESFGVQEIVKLYTVGNYSKNRTVSDVTTYTLVMDRDSNLYVSGQNVDNVELYYDDESGNLYYEE